MSHVPLRAAESLTGSDGDRRSPFPDTDRRRVLARAAGLTLEGQDTPPSPLRPGPPAASDTGAQTEARIEHSLRAVGRGSAISLIGSVSQVLLTAFAYIIAVRILSVASWGEFTLGVSVTGLLSLVGLLGMGQAMARSLAFETDPAERRAIVRWGIGVASAAAVALSLTVFISAPLLAQAFHNSRLTEVFELMSVAVGYGIISAAISGIFQGFKDVIPNALITNGLNAGLFFVFLIALLGLDIGLRGVILAYLLAAAVSLGLLVGYAERNLSRHVRSDVRPHRRPRKTLWQFTLAFWGSNNLAYVTAYADTLILGVFWPTPLVGYYSAAMTLARILLFGTTALAFIFLPVSASLTREGDPEAIRRTYLTSTRWVLVVTIPFFLLFAFAPRDSMELVWGHRYLPGATALQILVITSFFASLVGPVQSTLAGLGQAKMLVWTATASAISNIALSLLLIPPFGLVGAAIAWGVARAILPLLGLGILWNLHRITSFRRSVLVPVGITLAIGGPVVLVTTTFVRSPWTLVPLFFFCAGLYVLTVLLTRALSRSDLLILGGVERFIGRPLPELRRFLLRFVSEPAPGPLPSART